MIRTQTRETDAKPRCVHPSERNKPSPCHNDFHHPARRDRPRCRPLHHKTRLPSDAGRTLVLPFRCREKPQVLVPARTGCSSSSSTTGIPFLGRSCTGVKLLALSSLLAFASPSESRERAQSGSATSNSTDALRRDEALPNLDSEVALRYSHRKLQVSKLQERSSSRSSEKKRQRSTILDQASNDALFKEFLLWKERQSTVDALDESGRDALFREFLHWNERQPSDKP